MLTPHTPFTTPPITDYAECAHIVDEKRRTVCEIVQFADGLIADIVEAVQRAGQWEDTVLVFLSDNGGATGSGRVQNLVEGGIRTASFVFGG